MKWPRDDDELWYVKRSSRSFGVQFESRVDGKPPFLLEADGDVSRTVGDVGGALRVLAFWLRTERAVTSDVRLVQDLVTRFPVFHEAYYGHAFDPGEVLPHVIFWDVAQTVVKAFVADDVDGLDWRAVLEFLERQVCEGDREVTTVIVTSFLYYLPHPDKVGHDIIEHLGSAMAQLFRGIRPSG